MVGSRLSLAGWEFVCARASGEVESACARLCVRVHRARWRVSVCAHVRVQRAR